MVIIFLTYLTKMKLFIPGEWINRIGKHLIIQTHTVMFESTYWIPTSEEKKTYQHSNKS